MNSKLSFQERAQLGMELLSKQLPTSLIMAKEQVQKLKSMSKSKSKKKKI